MQLEEVQLAIRPRTILECFDMAFLFCGRHWLGLLTSAAVGILPLTCFNWWIADLSQMNGYETYLLMMMEIPWATMWITLYLGQIIFSRHLSIRRMIRDAVRAVPGLIAFQGIIRGVCLALIFLAPLVFVGMYFLNEIILLEKSPVSKIWSRRSAMNRQILGHLFSVRLIELLALIGGANTLASLLQAVSALWEDESVRQHWLLAEETDIFAELFMMDWRFHASFWAMMVFLTVFRFVMYLDSRIRREGWDVELKLRDRADFYHQREAAE